MNTIITDQAMVQALREICATVDETGRCHGHWHGVAVKIARAALFGFEPDLSEKDRARIFKALPLANITSRSEL